MATVALPTYDYESEQAALLRKQKIADLMYQQSVSPIEIQQSGPVAARISPFAGLAKVFQGYMAGKENDAVAKERQGLAERYKNDTVTGMEDYMKTSKGWNEETTNPEDGSLGNVRHAADPQAAILKAIASNNPVLRQLGMAQMAEQAKNQIGVKDLLSHADPASIPGMLQNGMGAFQPKVDVKAYAPGEVLLNNGRPFNPSTAFPNTDGTPSAPGYSITTGPHGELLQQSPTGLRVVDPSPKVSVNNSMINAGPKKGMETFWTKAADQVDSMGKTAATAQNLIPQISKFRELEASGIFSNSLAGLQAQAANLAQALGVKVDTSKLGNTEAADGIAKKMWVDMIQANGGAKGWTEPETKIISKATANITTSPEARRILLNMMESRAKSDITRYHEANKSFARATKADDPEIWANELQDVYTPAMPAPGAKLPAGSVNPNATKW